MYRTLAEAIAFMKKELVPMNTVTSAPNYLGEEWPGWYIAYSGLEGEPLDECNLIAFQTRLSEAGFTKDVNYQEVSLENWCGPAGVYLLVRLGEVCELSRSIRAELEAYPVLDDDLAFEMGVFEFEEEGVEE